MEQQSTERPPLAWRDPNTPIKRQRTRKNTITPSGRKYRQSRLESINQGEEWRPKRGNSTRYEPVFTESDEEPTTPETPLIPPDIGPAPPRLVHPPSDLKPGTIIRGQFYAEYTPSSYETPDKDCYETRWGKVYGKERHMVIVNRFTDHYVALPVFSHRGTGTANKKNRNEFVTIHDHRHTKPVNPQSEHKPLFTGSMDKGIYLFRRLSVVHITGPMCKNFLHPVVREGELTPESTAALIQLYVKYCPPKAKEECSESTITSPGPASARKFSCASSTSTTGSFVKNQNRRWSTLFSGGKRESVNCGGSTPIGSFDKLNLR